MQAIVKYLRQVRILDEVEREKASLQQVLQLDVMRGHEHLSVRAERLEDRLAGGDSLRRIGTTKQFIDEKHPTIIDVKRVRKQINGYIDQINGYMRRIKLVMYDVRPA